MSSPGVRFSIASNAAWAPGLPTREAWLAWARQPFRIEGGEEPAVRAMPAMLRRRAGLLSKMALEVAYQCLGERTGVPTVFCSRHGEVSRSVDLLSDLAQGMPLSPTSFGLSVHNASGGLFSIARGDRANNIALVAGRSTVEHAVIEACGMLADGEPEVLLVAYDSPLPAVYAAFQECDEQAFAWAWLMRPAGDDAITLSWSATQDNGAAADPQLPAGLEILRSYLRQERELERICDGRRWRWVRHA